MRLSALAGFAALALALGPNLARASVVFTDTTFDLTAYQPLQVFKSNAATSFSAAQCAACGDTTPQALSIATSFPNGGALTLGFINDGFAYDPATQGAIEGLFASVSKNLTTPLSGLQGNTFRPLILQGGAYYMAVINGANVVGPTTTGYRTLSGALSAASFNRYDFALGSFVGGSPDFAGGRMRFGLAQFSSGLPAGGGSLIRFDNLSFDITSTPPAPTAVPEPAAWALMIAGFGLAGAALRRRRAAPA